LQTLKKNTTLLIVVIASNLLDIHAVNESMTIHKLMSCVLAPILPMEQSMACWRGTKDLRTFVGSNNTHHILFTYASHQHDCRPCAYYHADTYIGLQISLLYFDKLQVWLLAYLSVKSKTTITVHSNVS